MTLQEEIELYEFQAEWLDIFVANGADKGDICQIFHFLDIAKRGDFDEDEFVEAMKNCYKAQNRFESPDAIKAMEIVIQTLEELAE